MACACAILSAQMQPAVKRAVDAPVQALGGSTAGALPVLSSAAEMMRLGLPGSVMSFFTLSS